MAQDDTGNPALIGATPYLYPEYQAQLSNLARQRMLAQYLFQHSMGRPTEMVSGRAVRQSPLGRLAQALTLFGANKQMGDTTAQQQNILLQNAAKEQQDLQGLMAQPDMATRISTALTSQNPRLQGYGKLWEQARLKKEGEGFTAGIRAMGEGGDTASAVKAASAGVLPSNYQTPERRAPTVTSMGNGQYQVTNYDKFNVPKASINNPRSTTSIENKIPGLEIGMLGTVIPAAIKERREMANEAITGLQTVQAAVAALEKGAKAGGGEDWKQSLRQLGNAFGISLPENTPTTELQMALGQKLLGSIRKLAPVTAEDVIIINRIEGSIATDKAALLEGLALYQKKSLRALKNYNDYIAAKRDSSASEYARSMWSGEDIGYKMEPGWDRPVPTFEQLNKQLTPVPSPTGKGQVPLNTLSDQQKRAQLDAMVKQLGPQGLAILQQLLQQAQPPKPPGE